MWTKFKGPSYAGWSNVISAIHDCEPINDFGEIYGKDDQQCWNVLNCALEAADASQQAQYSSAATILGLVGQSTKLTCSNETQLIFA
jgi:hypothetical protein